jgi:hemoglobin
MAADFKRSLDRFKVPAAEQNELFTIVGSVKSQIVTAGSGR